MVAERRGGRSRIVSVLRHDPAPSIRGTIACTGDRWLITRYDRYGNRVDDEGISYDARGHAVLGRRGLDEGIDDVGFRGRERQRQ